MGETTLPGNPPVEIIFRESPRARRLSLRVSRLDGRVTLTVPRGFRRAEAMSFAAEKEDWIRRALATGGTPLPVVEGAILPVEGSDLSVEYGSVRAARVDGARLILPAARPGPAALAWLKSRARERLWQRSGHHAEAIGRDVRALTLRDPRSRWGSCSHDGRLMFSWRLIMAPPEVLNYVAAHEAAHLAEMNHSPAFWKVVDRLCPDWQRHRDWLRTRGTDLHRYRFTD